MWEFLEVVITNYGIGGAILFILVGCIIYQLRYAKTHNYTESINSLGEKIDCVDTKVNGLSDRITNLENDKVDNIKNIKNQTISIMTNGIAGKMSSVLKDACDIVNCDHIFFGSFHDGTTDLRGIHYCKFDILIDEFREPLNLNENDCDFQQLYKDENIIAYGDFPYNATKVDSCVFDLDTDDLLNLSDTLYRHCIGRKIKQIAFSVVKDSENCPIGFIGCVNYTRKDINLKALEQCSANIENIYNK